MKPKYPPVHGRHLPPPRLTPMVPFLLALVLSAPFALASLVMALL